VAVTYCNVMLGIVFIMFVKKAWYEKDLTNRERTFTKEKNRIVKRLQFCV